MCEETRPSLLLHNVAAFSELSSLLKRNCRIIIIRVGFHICRDSFPPTHIETHAPELGVRTTDRPAYPVIAGFLPCVSYSTKFACRPPIPGTHSSPIHDPTKASPTKLGRRRRWRQRRWRHVIPPVKWYSHTRKIKPGTSNSFQHHHHHPRSTSSLIIHQHN